MLSLRGKARSQGKNIVIIMSAKKFIVTEHNAQGRLVLAVCDKKIHGKKFEDNNAVLDLNSKFFNGHEKWTEEVEKLMRQSYTINAAGKNSVNFTIKLGLASNPDVKKVAGTPHVHVLMP